MIVLKSVLEQFVSDLFHLAGCRPEEAMLVAKRLVAGNLAGYDSHGVIRVPLYLRLVREEKIFPNRHISVVSQIGAMAILDGNFGFGQVIGGEAVRYGIQQALESGMAVIGLRNSGHLGRIGDWAHMAADFGFVSLHFANTSGFGILVAPHGGSDRRLSANPIAIGIPRPKTTTHIIVDISTCAVSEGKIMVARNNEKTMPEGVMIDGYGKPTIDPNIFYAEPKGAILPLGGHKGFGLGIACEIFAGALTGSGCSNPANETASTLVNGMLSIYLNPVAFGSLASFDSEVDHFVEWVKDSPPSDGEQAVRMPGEQSANTTRYREKNGIPLDEKTLRSLHEEAERLHYTERLGE